jgi:branched-chain amino acid transport system substrate-binding protein
MRSSAIRLAACLLGVIAATASGTAAWAAGDDVVIGVLTDMSGVGADNTGRGSVVAAELAIAQFGGRVLGKPIRLLSADHQNKADIGAAIARQWIDQENVAAIVDVPNSSVGFAVQALTRQSGRVFLMSSTGSSDFTGPACSPTGVQWTYDTYALAHATGDAVVRQGGKSWFFITADYAFGQALERDASRAVIEAGGTVVGGVRSPLGTSDFASFLVQAQASKAQIVALATVGTDTATALKQFSEFGMRTGGQSLAGLLTGLNEIRAVGLEATQGMMLTEAFYWDLSDATRAFSRTFFARVERMPSQYQAGVYSVVLHYLKAMQQAGTSDGAAVVAAMRALPVDDFFATHGRLREDGRMVHDMYLFKVKSPGASTGPWDLYDLVATIPGDQAFRPLKDGGCPYIQP